ncbi:hypothetical protein EGW08_005272 [Elysia chlorotica]|uniref:Endonuclease/exonuclease/phosphatase domain-containing protein n=1 Tax=Elysia chlorotica TaxID=188477 RepID=A0A3S1BF86_ELYCH|nr:hypothetical protein EGW08_005272 [Elysia chlorotica]
MSKATMMTTLRCLTAVVLSRRVEAPFIKGTIPNKRDLIKKRRKRKQKRNEINKGTWNMQTMQENGGHIDLAKLDLLLVEFKEQKLNILGLCETRWSKQGKFNRGEYTVVHSGSEKGGHKGVAVILDKYHGHCLKSYNSINDRIMMIKLNTKPVPLNIIQVYAPTSQSSDEDIEHFYNDLQSVKDSISSKEICIVMGDLNAKVGEGEDNECGIGRHGLGGRNERGYTLETSNRFKSLLETWAENETLPNEIWEDMKVVYTQASITHIGKKKKMPQKPFLSTEALQFAKEKRAARKTNDEANYKRLKRETRRQIREDKRIWLEEECAK